MEIYIILVLIAVSVVLFSIVTKNSSSKRKVFKNNSYSYASKDLPMTRVEREFFFKLEKIVNERYFVFPQVHLSAILDYRVKGQDWSYAFRHINGKSVDFVLCDRITLRPAYAIELDDYTHDKADRQKRDVEVERMLNGAKLPLIRFRNKDISDAEIIQALSDSFKR